jgi:hypothetical protein
MGNTKVVDLGYYDYGYHTLVRGTTRTISDSTFELQMLDMKQRLIDGGLNDGVNWSLSRLVKQVGTFDANYGRGWCLFVVKHLVAGSPSGDEWLIGFPYPSAQAYSCIERAFGTNAAQNQEYWTWVGGTSIYVYGSSPSVLFHYNPNGLTSTYDIGSGDDFDPPSTNPKTDLPGFMPTGNCPKGMFGRSIAVTAENKIALIFNPQERVIGWGTGNEWTNPDSFVFMGRIFLNKRSADVHDYGGMYMGSGPTTDAELTSAIYISALDDVDNHIICWVKRHSLFLQENQPYFDGSVHRFHRDKAVVYNASYIKGELKPSLFPVQGAFNRHYLRMYDSEHGRALKINNTMCVPWADDVPAPFAGWPLNPQIPTIGP